MIVDFIYIYTCKARNCVSLGLDNGITSAGPIVYRIA